MNYRKRGPEDIPLNPPSCGRGRLEHPLRNEGGRAGGEGGCLPVSRFPQGFALVSALAFLLVITLLGVSLFLGVNLQQKAAGNSLQKTRALELANSATIAAERWLAGFTDELPAFQSCSASNNKFRVCVAPPDAPAQPKRWKDAGATWVSLASLKISESGGTNTYFSSPGVWITYLGRATMGPGSLYLIDAYAWGGNEKSLVVTETVFYAGGDPHRSTGAQNMGH